MIFAYCEAALDIRAEEIVSGTGELPKLSSKVDFNAVG